MGYKNVKDERISTNKFKNINQDRNKHTYERKSKHNNLRSTNSVRISVRLNMSKA